MLLYVRSGWIVVRSTNRGARRKPFEIDGVITDILTQSEQPIGAYEIAKQAKEKSYRLSPTQVYRCLDRLLKSHIVEQVASQNAYIIATGSTRVHLLCKVCGQVESIEEGTCHDALLGIAKSVLFQARTTHIEISGQCKSCRG